MNAYTMFRCFLVAGLLLIGCGDDPSNGTPEIDAGAGGALAGDAGPGGSGGAAGGHGGVAVDGGGTGGIVTPGTGGAGTGGAVGSGGARGSGGAGGIGGVSGSGGNQGTGGTVADTACVDPMGWRIDRSGACVGPSSSLKKAGRICYINCGSTQPNGLPGNNIGPPFHSECSFDFGRAICVASCGECS